MSLNIDAAAFQAVRKRAIVGLEFVDRRVVSRGQVGEPDRPSLGITVESVAEFRIGTVESAFIITAVATVQRQQADGEQQPKHAARVSFHHPIPLERFVGPVSGRCLGFDNDVASLRQYLCDDRPTRSAPSRNRKVRRIASTTVDMTATGVKKILPTDRHGVCAHHQARQARRTPDRQ